MKHNFFFKLLISIIFSSTVSLSYAADWYISSTGSDALPNDGSAGAPWASFSKAQTAASSGDIIHVSGMIDFTLDPANTTTNAGTTTSNKAGIIITKSLTIQGTSASADGFNGTNGANTTRFFQITNALYTLTLRNIKLANGVAQSTSNTAGGGALMMTIGNIVAENVIFDGNSSIGYNGILGAAVYIGGSNTIGTSFKNCVFKNNISDKAGAVYINTWAAGTVSVPSIILFENCSFVGNEAKNTGGSAIMARSASEYTTLNIINCTFSKNKVTTASNGGTINMGAKGMRYMNMNIINCTVTENTTAGSTGNGAGINYVNTGNNNIGNLYIKNSIIENNTTTAGAYSDLNLSAASPTVPETGTSTTVPGYIKIENSFIGAHISDNTRVPAGNIVSSQVGYLTSTSTINNLKASLAPFNATTNSFSLYNTSAAIGYGNSSLLSSYSTTDQLGNVRTVGATNYAGAWESTPLAPIVPAAPAAPTATAGNAKALVTFTIPTTNGGSPILDYTVTSSPGGLTATGTASPLVVTGLTNDQAYTFTVTARNAIGSSVASSASVVAVTPTLTASQIIVSTATNVSALTRTAISDIVVSSNLLTIDANTAISSLTVAPGAQVTVNATRTLTTTDGITLQSSENGTATLVDNNASSTITATVQQYLSSTSTGTTGRNWYISSPLSAALSSTITTATGNGLVYYDGTTNWPAAGTTMEVMKGYIAKSPAQNTTVNFTGGTLNTGNKSVIDLPLGFNLVGNPYPSYVDFAQATKTNVTNSIWYRSKKEGTYNFHTYNVIGGVSINDGTAIIPPMQSFWIKTTSATNTFGFTNVMRSHQDQSVAANRLKAPKVSPNQLLRLQVSNATNRDETVIYFNSNAQNTVDEYDSPKMFESATATTPEIYTSVGNEKLVINGFSAIPYDVEIPLGFIAKQAGDFSISRSEMTNFDAGTRIVLKDKLHSAAEIELSEGSVYNFSSEISSNADRFSLIFRAQGAATGVNLTDNLNAQVFVNAANQITIIAPENCSYAIYNAVGQIQLQNTLTSTKTTLTKIFNAGVYFVRLSVNGQRNIQKVVIR